MKEIVDLIDQLDLETLNEILIGNKKFYSYETLNRVMSELAGSEVKFDEANTRDIKISLNFILKLSLLMAIIPNDIDSYVNRKLLEIRDDFLVLKSNEIEKLNAKISLIKNIEKLIEESMSQDQSLRSRVSTANKILKKIKGIDLNNLTNADLDVLISEIQTLSTGEIEHRVNPKGIRTEDSSISVYENILNTIGPNKENKKPNHAGKRSSYSDVYNQLATQVTPKREASPTRKTKRTFDSDDDSISEKEESGLNEPEMWKNLEKLATKPHENIYLNQTAEGSQSNSFRQLAADPMLNPFSEQLQACLEQPNSIASSNDSENLRKIDSEGSTSETLSQITGHLRNFEKLKYPASCWKYTRFPAQNPGEKNIVKIEYDSSGKLTDKDAKNFTKYSLATRKLSLISGVLTLLDHPDYLTNDPIKKEAIRKHLAQLSNQIIENVNTEIKDPKKEIDQFSDKLVKDLTKLSGSKGNVTRQVRQAERYFNAEYNKNKVLVVMSEHNGKQIIQMDVNLNHQLTDDQKQDYMQIHNKGNEPEWFTNLSRPEQEWYLERVPHHLEPQSEWQDFESLFKSSAMQHTPGIANARLNILFQRDNEGNVRKLSESVKTGTPVLYEMSYNDSQVHSKKNAEQLIQIASKVAQNNFDDLWGDFFKEKNLSARVPILVQSLLSGKLEAAGFQLASADQSLITRQQEAMDDASRSDVHFDVIYHNTGTNAFALPTQHKMTKIKQDPELKNLIDSSRRFLIKVLSASDIKDLSGDKWIKVLFNANGEVQQKALIKLINTIDSSNDFTQEQKYALKTLLIVTNELNHLAQTKAIFGRNKAEYLIALKKMLVEAMGGVVTNNCKSGKDRTGQSELYQHALALIAAENNGQFPSYDDVTEARSNFCSTLADLNVGGKHYAAGETNTPGSFGTKAPEAANIHDLDVTKTGDFKTMYPVFTKLAATNKPSNFVADESKQAKELKIADGMQLSSSSDSSPESSPNRLS